MSPTDVILSCRLPSTPTHRTTLLFNNMVCRQFVRLNPHQCFLKISLALISSIAMSKATMNEAHSFKSLGSTKGASPKHETYSIDKLLGLRPPTLRIGSTTATWPSHLTAHSKPVSSLIGGYVAHSVVVRIKKTYQRDFSETEFGALWEEVEVVRQLELDIGNWHSTFIPS